MYNVVVVYVQGPELAFARAILLNKEVSQNWEVAAFGAFLVYVSFNKKNVV